MMLEEKPPIQECQCIFLKNADLVSYLLQSSYLRSQPVPGKCQPDELFVYVFLLEIILLDNLPVQDVTRDCQIQNCQSHAAIYHINSHKCRMKAEKPGMVAVSITKFHIPLPFIPSALAISCIKNCIP